MSRNHASIRMDKELNQIIISDAQSKFGTLLLLKTPIEVPELAKKLQL